MKKLTLIVLASLMAFSAQAIEKAAHDGQKLGRELKNGNYALGRVYLSESDKTFQSTDVDAFSLRNCASKENAPITRLRLRAPALKVSGKQNLDALIRTVTVIFGNGLSKTFKINQRLIVSEDQGDALDIVLSGGKQRCVRAVSVNGEQYEAGKNKSNSQVLVVGVTKK